MAPKTVFALVLAAGVGCFAREVVKVPGWPEMKSFPLSFGIKTDDMVFASGLAGIDMHTMRLVPGGAGPETTQTLSNLRELLAAAGASLQDVVECSVSLVNVKRDFAAVNKAYAAFWPEDPPARVAVQVAALAANASVEIQCNAALKGERTVVKVPGWPELKGFPLSMAIEADEVVYLSGSQGIDMTTMKMVTGGVAEETRQTLANLKAVLEAAGSGPGRVLGCSVSLKNMSDFATMNEAYAAFWPHHGVLGGLPSRVCVEVADLAGSGSVEIQCTAVTSRIHALKVVKVPGWKEMPSFPFSSATIAGDMVYISGMQGVDMRTGTMAEGGVGPETQQTLLNVGEALRAAGASLEDVVACEVSLRDIKDFRAMNGAYAEFWPQDPPSRVAVQVGGLARGAAVEIRCTAALPAAAAAAAASAVSPLVV